MGPDRRNASRLSTLLADTNTRPALFFRKLSGSMVFALFTPPHFVRVSPLRGCQVFSNLIIFPLETDHD
jgi:hypothetical protein